MNAPQTAPAITRAARAAEAERQRALIGAIFAVRGEAGMPALGETGERAQRGLAAYRANAEALAGRALGAAFGRIRAMLGDDDFAHLAAEFWRAHPPQHGDVGEWGGEFADWLQAHAAMARWPYVADCARLDFALHRSERAADAGVDVDSLALLGSEDPRHLRLLPMPGMALVSSRWPIVTIHHAHRTCADADFEHARSAIERESPQHALVWRDGWRAAVSELTEAEASWMTSLLAGADLACALDRAGPAFDFSAWLARALRQRWLTGVVRLEG